MQSIQYTYIHPLARRKQILTLGYTNVLQLIAHMVLAILAALVVWAQIVLSASGVAYETVLDLQLDGFLPPRFKRDADLVGGPRYKIQYYGDDGQESTTSAAPETTPTSTTENEWRRGGQTTAVAYWRRLGGGTTSTYNYRWEDEITTPYLWDPAWASFRRTTPTLDYLEMNAISGRGYPWVELLTIQNYWDNNDGPYRRWSPMSEPYRLAKAQVNRYRYIYIYTYIYIYI